jgi:hypothetical protein
LVKYKIDVLAGLISLGKINTGARGCMGLLIVFIQSLIGGEFDMIRNLLSA